MKNPIIRHCRNCEYHKPAFLFDVWCNVKYKWQKNGRKSAIFCKQYKQKVERKVRKVVMENLINTLKRYDNLETVIAVLEAYDDDGSEEMTVDEIAEYLSDEADYAS